MSSSVEFVAGALVSIAVILGIGGIPTSTAFSSSNKKTRIEVGGFHEVRRAPELCDLYLRLRDESKEPGKSMQLVSEAAESLAEQVRELAPAKAETGLRVNLDVSDASDIPEEFPPSQPDKPVTSWSLQQIRTWTYESLPPAHHAPNPDPDLYGRFYVAEASAKITFHDFNELSAFVSDIADQPVVNIDRLSWRLSKGSDKGLGDRVRQAALRDAIQKADNYAQVLNPKDPRVQVVEVTDNGGSGGGRPAGGGLFGAAPTASLFGAAKAGAMHEQSGVTIEPEPITVTSNVFVKFDVNRM